MIVMIASVAFCLWLFRTNCFGKCQNAQCSTLFWQSHFFCWSGLTKFRAISSPKGPPGPPLTKLWHSYVSSMPAWDHQCKAPNAGKIERPACALPETKCEMDEVGWSNGPTTCAFSWASFSSWTQQNVGTNELAAGMRSGVGNHNI